MKNNFDLRKFLTENKLTSNSRLFESQEISKIEFFFKKKGYKVEEIPSGNEGERKSKKIFQGAKLRGKPEEVNKTVLLWPADGYKSSGKDIFYIYFDHDEDLVEEIKKQFDVVSVYGSPGYYNLIIAK